MRRITLACSLLILTLLPSLTAQTPAADPWARLRFLVGTWEAKTQGGSAGADASGEYVFQLELKSHVLARHTMAAGCKGPADFDCEHGDLLYAYADAATGAIKAIYFDNEGHTIRYDVSTPSSDNAVFLSDAKEPGPQFKLSYALKSGVMQGTFEIKMPGQNAFMPYLNWSGAKKK